VPTTAYYCLHSTLALLPLALLKDLLGDSNWWKWRYEEPKPYSNSGDRLVYFFENLIFLKNL